MGFPVLAKLIQAWLMVWAKARACGPLPVMPPCKAVLSKTNGISMQWMERQIPFMAGDCHVKRYM